MAPENQQEFLSLSVATLIPNWESAAACRRGQLIKNWDRRVNLLTGDPEKQGGLCVSVTS
jgi:hypothetical protein